VRRKIASGRHVYVWATRAHDRARGAPTHPSPPHGPLAPCTTPMQDTSQTNSIQVPSHTPPPSHCGSITAGSPRLGVCGGRRPLTTWPSSPTACDRARMQQHQRRVTWQRRRRLSCNEMRVPSVLDPVMRICESVRTNYLPSNCSVLGAKRQRQRSTHSEVRWSQSQAAAAAMRAHSQSKRRCTWTGVRPFCAARMLKVAWIGPSAAHAMRIRRSSSGPQVVVSPSTASVESDSACVGTRQ
jgi:hypothetical protein